MLDRLKILTRRVAEQDVGSIPLNLYGMTLRQLFSHRETLN